MAWPMSGKVRGVARSTLSDMLSPAKKLGPHRDPIGTDEEES